MRGFVQGNDVFQRRIGLQIVTQRNDKAGLIAGQCRDQALHLGAHGVRRAKGQGLLVVDAAMKTEVADLTLVSWAAADRAATPASPVARSKPDHPAHRRLYRRLCAGCV